MEYIESDFNGYKLLEFKFDNKNAKLVVPENPLPDKKWLFKTEYFGAFPAFELSMLEKGYYVANIENTTRWCLEEDTVRQAEFAKFLQKEFSLNEKCILVGMSCGGMQSVYLSAKYPQLVAGAYLDAPVMNYLSCPCGIGIAGDDMYEEFNKATGLTVSQLINYRKHPVDYAEKMIENKIPVFLVCGDSDTVVPFTENGKALYEKYVAAGAEIQLVLKPGCNHHPHGLDDNTPIINFALGLNY